MEGGTNAPIFVGAIVLDDAQTCVEQIRSQFTISLKNDHGAYKRLLKLFAPGLAQQKAGTFAEIVAEDFSKFMAVPYWVWADAHAEVVRILTEYRDDNELQFVWPLLKDILPNCDCVISGAQLQIVARVTQSHLIPSFASAKRKVYLSATLLDDSQMARDLGVPAESVGKQIKPNVFDDLGERLILIPSDIHLDLGTSFVITTMKASKQINRVALVPMNRERGKMGGGRCNYRSGGEYRRGTPTAQVFQRCFPGISR